MIIATEIILWLLSFILLVKIFWEIIKYLFVRLDNKKDKDKELTMNDLLFRTMILQGTLVSIIGFCTILFLDKDTYLATNSLLNLIQYSILIISFFLIAL